MMKFVLLRLWDKTKLISCYKFFIQTCPGVFDNKMNKIETHLHPKSNVYIKHLHLLYKAANVAAGIFISIFTNMLWPARDSIAPMIIVVGCRDISLLMANSNFRQHSYKMWVKHTSWLSLAYVLGNQYIMYLIIFFF